MAHLLGIDIGTSGTKTLICDQKREGAGHRDGGASHLFAAAGVVGAGSAGLVAGRLQGDQSRAEEGEGQVRRHQGDRPFRADARQRISRMMAPSRCGLRCFGTISARPSNAGRSKQKAGGREALIELVANPALTGFTAPKILWVRQHEPEVYAQDQAHSAAQGLHPLSDDRRIRHRSQRRQRDAAAGCRQSHVVGQAAGPAGDRQIPAAAIARIAEITGMLHKEGAAALGLKDGHARRRRGGGSGGGSGRQWHRHAGHRQRDARHQRRGLRAQRCADARSAGARSYDVPCRAGQMVRLRLHALGGRQLPMAAK